MAEKSRQWLNSFLVVGVWGALFPWIWFKFLAGQILHLNDLDRLAEWVRYVPGLHFAVLGVIFALNPRLHELRQMEQLDRELRFELTEIVEQLSGRLFRMAMVVVVSILVCLAAPMFKGDDLLRFAMIFAAGSTVYFSSAFLLALFVLSQELSRQKTRISDHDRDKRAQIELIKALKEAREKEYKPLDALDKYNEFIQPPTTQIH
ncbi:hypothetical protein SIID45300_01040 [Candidatus Magnetaquicoccaceae bacterium FCR-1]|uniref:Uncharacterized protein n=1 Tax=Candidatus Magnetaquiglobus chichijimensis TaxID=3141448 RepID=A0ABQ0C771_9PROT